MKERDNQRARLYAAENEAFGKGDNLKPIATKLPKVKDVERYVKRQMKRATLKKRYSSALNNEIEIHDGRGHRCAKAYGTRTIAIPLWARCDWVVLHETAHIIHARILRIGYRPPGSRLKELYGGAPHGWQFAAIYMDLVRFCMGKEAADTLKAEFKKHKVRFTKPRNV